MKKIKRIFVGALLCMMFMLSSSDVVAQTFVEGADAIANMNQELPIVNDSYFALDKNSSTFFVDATAVKMKYRAIEQLLEQVSTNSTASDVEVLLREFVILESKDHTPITESDYEQANYGSTEVTNLRAYLFGVLTN